MSLPKSYAEAASAINITVPLLWEEKSGRVTRSGIRRFLLAAWTETMDINWADPPWLRLWKQIQWTKAKAKELHVVLPPELWDEDKARLAAKIAATRDTRYPEEKERALRWARR